MIHRLFCFLPIACGNHDKSPLDTGSIHESGSDSRGESESGPSESDSVHTSADDTMAEVDEICDGIDNDGDGLVDEGDAAPSTWYDDDDHDGYGDPDSSEIACDGREGQVLVGEDCDDTDFAVYPGAAETWYDGEDSDCDGWNDYDQDHDGDPAPDGGGSDCDDTDPERSIKDGCRPVVDCTSPSISTLADYLGISDIAFDDTCTLYAVTIISGTDYLYRIDPTGAVSIVAGLEDWDFTALGVRGDGETWMSHTNDDEAGVARLNGDAVETIASGTYLYGGSVFTNVYVGRDASSLAIDDAYLWIPNLNAEGELVRLDLATYGTTLLVTLSDRVEGIALDSAGEVLVTVGAELWRVNPGSGAASLEHEFGAGVFDIVIDYDDTVYAETQDGEVVTWDGVVEEVYAFGLVGEGKLAISPDGILARIAPDPVYKVEAYDEWVLP